MKKTSTKKVSKDGKSKKSNQSQVSKTASSLKAQEFATPAFDSRESTISRSNE